jgi:MFS family permease
MLHHYHRIKNELKNQRLTFFVILALNFFFSAAISLTIYIDSSYLSSAITQSGFLGDAARANPERFVGFIYTAAALITMLALILAPYVLGKVGNYRTTLVTLILYILTLLGLGLTESVILIVPSFVLAQTLIAILYFNFDIFLERYSKDVSTGRIRGIYMMLGSIAWLLPPVFSGYLSDAYGFGMVYLTAALVLLPCLFLVMRYLHHFNDMRYNNASFLMTREEVLRNKNIFNILTVAFFLHLFFAWIIIYSPLYLDSLGWTESSRGLLFTIALSAFIIFPLPAGWLADKYIGEKELLAGGFVLMGVSSILLPYLGAIMAPFWLWALILFVGRIGASTVETMTETYFFKHVNAGNAALVGYFRRTRPMAFAIAPFAASYLLETKILELPQIFILLGALMFVALIFIARLVDTK